MVDINIDLAKLRTLPLRLKVVIGVIAVDAVFLLSAYVGLDSLMAERVARIDQLKATLSQLHKQATDLRKQADEYPGLRHRYDSAMANGLAAPLDRLKLVQVAQDSASHRHLSELHYKLSTDPAKPESSPHFHIETDRVVLENGGLLDTDVLAFWGDVLSRLAGHYRVAELSLERIRDVDASLLATIRHGNPVSTLKARADFQWSGLQTAGQEPQ